MIGISLGPGDPQLLTFKAAAALKSCTKVFVPGEMAAELVRPYCRPEILQFPMIEDKEELERIWSKNADTVAAGGSRRLRRLCLHWGCQHLLHLQPPGKGDPAAIIPRLR